MLLTIKIKHYKDYSVELGKAKQVAEFAINNKFKTSSKLVKHIGLNSVISNQILKKYGQNKKAKQVSSVNLTIPHDSGKCIKIQPNNIIYVPCLHRLKIKSWYDLTGITKINQIEVSKEFYHITFEIDEQPETNTNDYIGVDLNASGYTAVIAINDKILKRNKKIFHIKQKFFHLRKKLQNAAKQKLIKKIKDKEKRIIKDLNHKLSKEIVELAKINGKGIRLENLTGIRDNINVKVGKTTRRIVNNWNYSQLREMVEYKAIICGVKVDIINPAYTSTTCPKCNWLGVRNKRSFKCINPSCGHKEHADSVGAFNIARGGVVDIYINPDKMKSVDQMKVGVSKEPSTMISVDISIKKSQSFAFNENVVCKQ